MSQGNDKTLAALDLGTNSTSLLLADRLEDGSIRECEEYTEVTQLGEHVSSRKKLTPEAKNRTLRVTADFMRHIRRYPKIKLIAVTTSALRDAEDGATFLDSCESLIKGRPLLLTGSAEATTLLRAVTAEGDDSPRIINIDAGGGSTEIAGGCEEKCDFCTSVNIGCVNLKEYFKIEGVTPQQNIEDARTEIRENLTSNLSHFAATSDFSSYKIVATGGAATTFAAMKLGLESYDANQVQGYVSSQKELFTTVEKLRNMPVEKIASLPCVGMKRAPVLTAGLVILSETLHYIGAEHFQVSNQGLRYGLLVRLVCGEIAPTVSW